MSLRTPEKVQKLQTALHAKAKESPTYRFYALYDKIYRRDILTYAYQCAKSKGGAGGVDGQTFSEIERYGMDRWLGELTEELRKKTYQPQALRRVSIPKPDGGIRPLSIPTIRDRVVQTAVVLVLGPIFEADLQPEQYAYRPGRNAHDAVRRVHHLLCNGHTDVVDADLAGYFDTIPHGDLMKSLARRICDRHLLHLIQQWLVVAVEEDDGRGGTRRTNRARQTRRGIPQGAPISPLLSNLYMRRLVLGWKLLGYATKFHAHIVNYADDLVILCRGTSHRALSALRGLVTGLKLTVKESKTHLCRLPEETFDFLGYTFGRCHAPATGRAYIGTYPSKKSTRKVCRAISELTGRNSLCRDLDDRVNCLNRLMTGWAHYFCLGPVSKAYRSVDAHARFRLRQWLCRKHKISGRGTARFPDEYFYDTLKLTRLTECTHSLPWANA
jgi:RNA-directed DNA polymerase